jgi:hypothetical protein
MKIKRFNESKEEGGKTFYKIIDKGKENKWLEKKFTSGKKTMVTSLK